MSQKIKSVRPFIGAVNFELSRNFYRDLGFQESVLFPNMSYFSKQGLGFYLQDAYVKDWIDNTVVFMEVDNVEQYRDELLALDLANKYIGVRLSGIRHESWGKQCFLHDPSGILWHFGEFLYYSPKASRNTSTCPINQPLIFTSLSYFRSINLNFN